MYTRDDVRKGLELVAALSTSQWKLGDMALQITGGNLMASTSDLARFADEIGLEDHQMHRYGRVAEKWPAAYRISGVPWTLHRTLTEGARAADYTTPEARHARLLAYAQQCRAKLVRPSYRGLQVFLGERPTPQITMRDRGPQVEQAIAEMATAERVDVVATLAADPDTMAAALADPAVRGAVFDAFRELNERESLHRPRPAREEAEPEASLASHLAEMNQVLARLMTARRSLNEAAEILNGSQHVHGNDGYREGVLAMTTGLRNRLDLIDGIAGGESFADGLEALLSGDGA